MQAPLAVEADTRALRQVLTNLIGNAVKYTKPGQRPHIEVRTESAPSGMVAIIVADRGIGIPEGQERDIFREFHRAAEHATAYPGTGLGLAICRRIVERHGGTIAARRRPGGGTLVSLTLPGTQACCSQGAGSGCGCGCGENAPESHSAVA
ncbi:MAG: ATP-binding protein [Austwickia sp.]|nr:ATP-binding protein [Austwickia sp.]